MGFGGRTQESGCSLGRVLPTPPSLAARCSSTHTSCLMQSEVLARVHCPIVSTISPIAETPIRITSPVLAPHNGIDLCSGSSRGFIVVLVHLRRAECSCSHCYAQMVIPILARVQSSNRCPMRPHAVHSSSFLVGPSNGVPSTHAAAMARFMATESAPICMETTLHLSATCSRTHSLL